MENIIFAVKATSVIMGIAAFALTVVFVGGMLWDFLEELARKVKSGVLSIAVVLGPMIVYAWLVLFIIFLIASQSVETGG